MPFFNLDSMTIKTPVTACDKYIHPGRAADMPLLSQPSHDRCHLHRR